MRTSVIYLDNAATSFPKPESVMEAMVDFSLNIGANPGRSGHRLSVQAGRVVYEARENVASLIGASDPMQIVITMNATMAINIALQGLLSPGDHVITSALEHNSVARTLRFLETKGVEFTKISCNPETSVIDAGEVSAAVKANTKCIVMMHASNVSGYIIPVRDIATIAHQHNLIFIVDGAQTAGAVPIDVEEDGIDIFVFTGHKGLLGPQGTGGLYIKKGLVLRPLLFGGTGSRSEHDRHPEFMPDCLEAGTPNTIGLAGLTAGASYLLDRRIADIRDYELQLSEYASSQLSGINGITIHGRAGNSEDYVSIFSLSISGKECSEVARILDEEFGIMVRSGLHCAPWAHEALGTAPTGTFRVSLSPYTTREELEILFQALEEISRRA